MKYSKLSVSGAPPQTPLGSIVSSPRPSSLEGLLAFGNRNFALAISLIYTF